MIHSTSNQHDVRILVLTRPADSLCALLPPFLQSQGYTFSESFTIYQAFDQMRSTSAHQSIILITRPAMLNRQAMLFINRHYPTLKIVGWCSSQEKVSDQVFTQIPGGAIVQVADTVQLGQVLSALADSQRHQCSCPQPQESANSESSDRLKYEITHDELTSLLEIR